MLRSKIDQTHLQLVLRKRIYGQTSDESCYENFLNFTKYYLENSIWLLCTFYPLQPSPSYASNSWSFFLVFLNEKQYGRDCDIK